MDLLKLSHPLGHTDDRLSGLERARCSGEASSSSSTAAVVGGNSSSGASQKVYVAVGKSVDKSVSLLQWTIQKFGKNTEICLAHVHQPSPYIPTLLGKLPASQANREVVASHREEEREKTMKLLQSYRDMFSKIKIKANIHMIEAEHIQTGLVDMVIQYRIRKLVMGSESDNCMKVRKSSTKANYAAKNAPAFCEIWFVNKGKHLWTREAFEGISFSSPVHLADPWISESLKSESLRFDEHEPLCCSERFRSNSFNLNTRCSGSGAWIHDSLVHREDALPHSDLLCSSPNRSATYMAHSSFVTSSSSSSGFASLAERRNYSDSNFKVEEESLNSLLEEAETSKHEASMEFLKRKKLEADAIQTISKVKELESAYEYEVNRRRESEDAVQGMMQEQERLLEERLEVMGELQKATRNVAVLDSRVQEANRRCEEAAGELKLIQASIISLHQEKQKIRRQKMEAERWLERWRSHRQCGGTDHNGFMGFLDDMPEVAEFTLVDLQTATCNFSDNFKLGERGYGTVYKGELLDKTVVIKKLHAHNMHGPLQFQKEVQVLGKLRHPHLVTLIGACPEAWSLVYDYLPNGSLEYRLFSKSNIAPLTWKDRARIISEISSALLFLHSSHPEKIIHGDLKPDNILLDSDMRCKIGDFGICRLVTEDGLRCPSFRRCAEPQGAFPYADPDLRRTGVLSPKSDIYSFGLVVLQLLTGRPPVGLVASVRKAVSSGRLASILDLSAGDWPISVARKLADMGLRFCELISRNRPDLTPILVRELQQLHASEEHQVPSFFLCPILQEIMHDPVVAADGFTYERQALRGWLQNGRETSPMTNLRLDHLHLTPNHTLRLAIQDWLCKS